ncbi:MAG: M24 family metallopeptidase [Chloroflexi bacterium]|nr:M24 family metallopeptidase [Chloroflexota bacterium]
MQSYMRHLSIQERDRRYALLREALEERRVDCAVVCASNLFYITNGILGERLGLLPTELVPPTVTLHWRNLVDIPTGALRAIQVWVQDLRQGNDASALVERIRELRLGNGVIGLGLANVLGQGGLQYLCYAELRSAFPSARFVDVSDIFTNVRMIKSGEEIAMIEEANRLFDLAVQAVRERVRPGVLGIKLVHEGMSAMWEAGGDLSSTLVASCGPVAIRQHVVQELSLGRIIEPGDIATLTGLARSGGYAGHSDQQICFGPVSALQRELSEAVRSVRDAVMKRVTPGARHSELGAAYQDAARTTRFRPTSATDIHSYGIDVPEHPTREGAGWNDRTDYVLQPGMIYSVSPALMARDSEEMVIDGASLVVTESGSRTLGHRSIELLSIDD